MYLGRRLLLLIPFLSFWEGLDALGQPAAGKEMPDFADYRKSGQVIRAYSGSAERSHYGVTLRLYEPRVRALASGTVYSAGRLRGYGNVVIIDHGRGWHTLYSHLGEIRVSVGQQVRLGAVIGISRQKRLFLVVSYRGNPINPSEVIRRRSRNSVAHAERAQSRFAVPVLATVAMNAG
jgi:murein DD-endopeptidase MepM/ murein hydrolase activator NlpD